MRWKTVQGGAEQGLEEKIIQRNKAASSPQMAPASILLAQTPGQ